MHDPVGGAITDDDASESTDDEVSASTDNNTNTTLVDTPPALPMEKYDPMVNNQMVYSRLTEMFWKEFTRFSKAARLIHQRYVFFGTSLQRLGNEDEEEAAMSPVQALPGFANVRGRRRRRRLRRARRRLAAYFYLTWESQRDAHPASLVCYTPAKSAHFNLAQLSVRVNNASWVSSYFSNLVVVARRRDNNGDPRKAMSLATASATKAAVKACGLSTTTVDGRKIKQKYKMCVSRDNECAELDWPRNRRNNFISRRQSQRLARLKKSWLHSVHIYTPRKWTKNNCGCTRVVVSKAFSKQAIIAFLVEQRVWPKNDNGCSLKDTLHIPTGTITNVDLQRGLDCVRKKLTTDNKVRFTDTKVELGMYRYSRWRDAHKYFEEEQHHGSIGHSRRRTDRRLGVCQSSSSSDDEVEKDDNQDHQNRNMNVDFVLDPESTPLDPPYSPYSPRTSLYSPRTAIAPGLNDGLNDYKPSALSPTRSWPKWPTPAPATFSPASPSPPVPSPASSMPAEALPPAEAAASSSPVASPVASSSPVANTNYCWSWSYPYTTAAPPLYTSCGTALSGARIHSVSRDAVALPPFNLFTLRKKSATEDNGPSAFLETDHICFDPFTVPSAKHQACTQLTAVTAVYEIAATIKKLEMRMGRMNSCYARQLCEQQQQQQHQQPQQQ